MGTAMNKAPIAAYIEGDTEDGVLAGLEKRGLIKAGLVKVGNKKEGKEEKNKALKLDLRTWFEQPREARTPKSLLVIRDQDQKQPEQIVESVQDLLKPYLPGAKLVPHPQAEGVYQLHDPESKLRLALVIARWDGVKPFFPDISNHAMDDYVLALAMLRPTAAAMLNERHESRRVLGVDKLLAKVQTEIPDLLEKNGLAPFIYAKDHIRFYAALLGTATSPVHFAKQVIEHADEAALRSHFASLLAAVAFLS
jgi:hypothetical protein